MIGSFKVRLLVVIVICTLVGCLMQTSSSRKVVEPVIKNMMDTNYDVVQVFSNMIANSRNRTRNSVPVMKEGSYQAPCQFLGTEKNYGWYFNRAQQKQVFFPGINLKVAENTVVFPVLPGKVERIYGKDSNRSIQIKHSGGYYSQYGGLKEVLIKSGDKVDLNSALGKTGKMLYIELRNQDGPIDPQFMFK